MVGVPRSQALIARKTAATDAAMLFQCPPNNVTLVKSAYFSAPTSASSLVEMLLLDSSSQTLALLFYQSLAANTTGSWQGWLALNPGYSVYVYAQTIGSGVYVSGAVLNGPPLHPPGAELTPAFKPDR